jgi:hypothetical protein
MTTKPDSPFIRKHKDQMRALARLTAKTDPNPYPRGMTMEEILARQSRLNVLRPAKRKLTFKDGKLSSAKTTEKKT